MDNPRFTNKKNEREEHIENLLLDCSTHLWVADDFLPFIKDVLERMPLVDLEQLDQREFRFLAPERVWGRAFRFPSNCRMGELVVFLSPELLSKPAEYIEAVIAHELAHVLLQHEEAPVSNAVEEAERREREADGLVKSWGFQLPETLFDRYE